MKILKNKRSGNGSREEILCSEMSNIKKRADKKGKSSTSSRSRNRINQKNGNKK